MSNETGGHLPTPTQRQFGAGIEDVMIQPLVLIALAAKNLFHATLSILIHILDYAFPILLQVMRFPLFTARIIGDGVIALARGGVRFLPVSGTKREAWRAVISEWWSWLRQKISYKAFEEFVHHAFEGGMAWVFRQCRTLTPGGALLVIAGAVLWLPVSFGVATAMHVALVAKAASLPAWMQLLHPVATIIAKSKLLVLPAYPAAWPQAKKHSSVQATFQFCRYLATRHLVRKTGHRYRQMERAVAATVDALRRGAAHIGLGDLLGWLLGEFNALVAWIGKASRAALTRTVEGMSSLPLVCSIVRSYAAHYDGVDRQDAEKPSEKISEFFARWSIKFSADYYEAKEKEEAAKAPAGTDHPSAAAPPHP